MTNSIVCVAGVGNFSFGKNNGDSGEKLFVRKIDDEEQNGKFPREYEKIFGQNEMTSKVGYSDLTLEVVL